MDNALKKNIQEKILELKLRSLTMISQECLFTKQKIILLLMLLEVMLRLLFKEKEVLTEGLLLNILL